MEGQSKGNAAKCTMARQQMKGNSHWDTTRVSQRQSRRTIGITSWLSISCLLSLLVLLSTMEGVSSQPTVLDFQAFQNAVGLEKTDLIIIMDRSESMNKQWFYQHIKKIVRALLERYVVVHQDYVRVTIITFSKDVSVDIDGISYPGITKCSLMNGDSAEWHKAFFHTAKENLVGTNIKEAFTKAKEVFESPSNLRKNETKKVILLITDGSYMPENDPFKEKEELDQLGYTIFAVGLGSWHVTGNVRVLASRPEYYGGYEDWEKNVRGSRRSPGAEAYPILVETFPSFCNSSMNNSKCYCEVLTGDYLTQCPMGWGINTAGTACEECPYHQFKSSSGNFQCTQCPANSGTRFRGSLSYNSCTCFDPSANNCNISNNPCDDPANKCSGDNQMCQNLGESAGENFRCVCKPGFTFNQNTRSCMANQNCDPAINTQAPCDEGHCVDMGLDFTCECDIPFTGRLCNINIDECRHPVCENGATCMDGNNYFSCICPPGFKGHYCKEIVTTTTSTTTTTTTAPPTTTTTTRPTTTRPTTTTTTPTTTTPTTTTKSTTRAPNELPVSNDDNKDKSLLYIIIGVACGVGLLLIIIIIIVVCCCCCRKKQSPQQKAATASTSTGTQSSVRFKKARSSIYKSISQRFSGIWKNKTIRGGMWDNDDNTKTGAPSAPIKRRPDLIASSLTDPKSHDLDEIVVSNEEIAEPSGMEGWDSYLQDLQDSDIIKYGVVAHVDGEKVAKSSGYIYSPNEMDRAHELLLDRNADVQIKVQGTTFEIEKNSGDYAMGRTVEDKAEAEVMLLSHTKKFIVALIAWDNAQMDMVTLEKELQYIVDCISGEGY